MKKYLSYPLNLLTLFLCCSVYAQDAKLGKQEIVSLLESAFDSDQSVRSDASNVSKIHGYKSEEYKNAEIKMIKQDSINQSAVFCILDKYGWQKDYSQKARNGIFYVIQHANLNAQLKYSVLLDRAFKNNEIAPKQYAFFVDRLCAKQYKNQMYGSQVLVDNLGNTYLSPLADPENVDSLRRIVGLPPIQQQIQEGHIKYYDFPPKKNNDDVLLIVHIWDANNKPVDSVSVWQGATLLGQTNENGICFVNGRKKKDATLSISFKKNEYKDLNYPIRGEKDFYEIRLFASNKNFSAVSVNW